MNNKKNIGYRIYKFSFIIFTIFMLLITIKFSFAEEEYGEISIGERKDGDYATSITGRVSNNFIDNSQGFNVNLSNSVIYGVSFPIFNIQADGGLNDMVITLRNSTSISAINLTSNAYPHTIMNISEYNNFIFSTPYKPRVHEQIYIVFSIHGKPTTNNRGYSGYFDENVYNGGIRYYSVNTGAWIESPTVDLTMKILYYIESDEEEEKPYYYISIDNYTTIVNNESIYINYSYNGNFTYSEFYLNDNLEDNSSNTYYNFTGLINNTNYNISIYSYYNASIFNFTLFNITTLQHNWTIEIINQTQLEEIFDNIIYIRGELEMIWIIIFISVFLILAILFQKYELLFISGFGFFFLYFKIASDMITTDYQIFVSMFSLAMGIIFCIAGFILFIKNFVMPEKKQSKLKRIWN